MNAEWKTATKYIIAVGLAIFFLSVLYISRSIVYLLITAVLISFVLRPLILFFINRLKFPRGLAVLLSHVIGFLILLLAPLILLPPILDAAAVLLNVDYQVLIDNSLQWFERTLTYWKEYGFNILGVRLVLDGFIDPILGYLQGVSPAFQPELPAYDVIMNSLTSAFTVSYGIAISLVGTVITGVVAFTLRNITSINKSQDWPKF